VIGQTLRHYEIVELLGKGGMGEVYAAQDTRLDRLVALKLLPEETADDPERRLRFEREAKAVAALNHPNIVTIHSVEEADGVFFITMELVRGQRLTELIPDDGLPLDQLFGLARPLADALAAAHQQGITHRDLKPDNVMVTGEGLLKVLDFGLAKLREDQPLPGLQGTLLPTLSVTADGRIMGTVAYMSPEQAEGRAIDPRSDVFSLGVMLYEMATGRRPFEGDTSISVLSSTLKDTPPSVTALSPKLPRHLGRIVSRCLSKDPARRYPSALDLRNELDHLNEEVASGDYVTGEAPSPKIRRRRWQRAAWIVTVALLLAGAGATARWAPWRRDPPPRPQQKTMTFTQLTTQPGQELFSGLSPEGGQFVFAAKDGDDWDIHLQRVGGENRINLTKDSPADDTQPAFSPDGRRIAFRSERDGGGIFIMGATGESVRRVTDFGFNPSWSPDGGEILCTTESIVNPHGRWSISQLHAVDVQTGQVRLLFNGDAVQASWSPNGKRIVFWGLTAGGKRDILTLASGHETPVPVTNDWHVDWNPVWSPDGRYIYFASDRGGAMNIWRIPIDEESGATAGEPEPVTAGVAAYPQHMAFSSDGRRMTYVAQLQTANIQRFRFDPAAERVVGQPEWITRGSTLAWLPDVSRDGEWLVYANRAQHEDLFVIRSDGSGRRQLTSDLHKDRGARWSPDGERIIFYSNRAGSYEIYAVNADGSGLEQWSNSPGLSRDQPVWSPDGSRIAYTDLQIQVAIAESGVLLEEQEPQPLPAGPASGQSFLAWDWSPDGDKLAGLALSRSGNPSGIVVFSFETEEYHTLTSFGFSPVWLSDSRRLLFSDQDQVHILDTHTGRHHPVLSIRPDDLSGAFTVSGDDRSIFVSRAISEADVWLVDLE
jgi:Tol biopolymer transport system component